MAGKDTNVGAKRARETRAALGVPPGAPVRCVLSLVERQMRVPVVIAALPTNIAGCCWRDGDRAVLWVNGTHAPTRQRFTLAHELGHLRCRHDGAVPVETFVTLGGMSTDSREVQANAFAAELLAPAKGVTAMVNGGDPALEDVVRVAAAFGISTIAALYRLNSLGLTKCYGPLAAAVADGEQEAAWKRLHAVPVRDAIAAIRRLDLPRFSPALQDSALAAVARGTVSTSSAAGSIGCDPGSLANGAAAIGI